MNGTDHPVPCDTMTINEFLFALNIDNINLVKLLQYVKESNIIYKVKLFSCLSKHFFITHIYNLTVLIFLRSVDTEIHLLYLKISFLVEMLKLMRKVQSLVSEH